MTVRIIAVAALLLAYGCQGTGRRFISNPGKDEVLRVVSGDRIYFDLEENTTAGFEWDYVCNDRDVEVTIDHVAADSSGGSVGSPGLARVCIRIHRGYDGPSNVHFKYRRQWRKGPPVKEFDIGLYKRTGYVAFWE